MEQRTHDILRLLLQENSFQKTADIAARLSVSGKTISRQLPKVEEFLESVGLRLEKKSGAGIKIVGSDVKRYALTKQLKSVEKREYTPNERRSIIISNLLSSHEPIKLFALSSAVHVTDSTISNDLDKLEPWFREQGLRLLRKPGLGVSLLGDERDFRRQKNWRKKFLRCSQSTCRRAKFATLQCTYLAREAFTVRRALERFR